MSRTIASSLALSALVAGGVFAIGAAQAQGIGTQTGVGPGANGRISTGVPALSPLTQDSASAKAGSSAHIKQRPTQSSSRSAGANADTGAAMPGGHGGADLRGSGKANGGATLN